MTDDNTIDTVFEPDGDEYPPDDDERAPRKRGPVPRGNSARLMAKERQRRALEMRKAGATYAAIAQALGYADFTGARAAVIKAFEEIIREPTMDLRGIQYERLNHMLMTVWPKVQTGDERAIASALSIMDRMDKLMGTEAAQQVDINVQGSVLVVDGNKDDYIAAMRKMAGPLGEMVPDYSQVALPPADDGIIDAEVIEEITDISGSGGGLAESLADALGEDGRAAVHAVMSPPQTQADPGTKPRRPRMKSKTVTSTTPERVAPDGKQQKEQAT